MAGWLSKKQISELKIERFNRKNWKKRRVKTPPNGSPTNKEEFAQKMRDNPTSSEHRLIRAMKRVRYENGWVICSQVVLGPYIVDIFIPNRKVVVEVDGASHKGREEYDQRRESFLWNSGFRVVRVTNTEVWQDLDASVRKIIEFVDKNGKKFKGWRSAPKHSKLSRVKVPNKQEIESHQTSAGGWTREQLAKWGVPWPPPRGWKWVLENEARQ